MDLSEFKILCFSEGYHGEDSWIIVCEKKNCELLSIKNRFYTTDLLSFGKKLCTGDLLTCLYYDYY